MDRPAAATYETAHSTFSDLLMVYGSGLPGGTTGYAEQMRQTAEYYRRGVARLQLARDADVRDEDLRGRDLLLIGSPDDNSIIRRVEKLLPVKIDAGGFEFGGRRYGPDRGLVLVQANPFDARRSLMLHLGAAYAGLDTTFSVPLGDADYTVSSRNKVEREGLFIYDENGRPAGIKKDDDYERLREDYAQRAVIKTLGHFEYHYVPGSRAEKDLVRISSFNENACSDLQKFFTLKDTPRTIRYYFYDSLGVKAAVTGEDANAHNDFATWSVHAAYADDLNTIGYHELAHLFATAAWGDTGTRLMGEGSAVFFDGTWWGKPLEYWAGKLWAEGAVPALKDLAGGGYWKKHSSEGYALSGCFFAYLRRHYTLDQVRRLYVSKFTPQDVKDIFGQSWDEFERGWREGFLRSPVRFCGGPRGSSGTSGRRTPRGSGPRPPLRPR